MGGRRDLKIVLGSAGVGSARLGIPGSLRPGAAGQGPPGARSGKGAADPQRWDAGKASPGASLSRQQAPSSPRRFNYFFSRFNCVKPRSIRSSDSLLLHPRIPRVARPHSDSAASPKRLPANPSIPLSRGAGVPGGCPGGARRASGGCPEGVRGVPGGSQPL